MKFSCIIFICPLVIVSVITTLEVNRNTLKLCNPDDWVITNITLKWENMNKSISFDTYFKELNGTIYRIHIEISCDDTTYTNCTTEPIVNIDNIDCNSENLSPPDMEVCKFANELGNLEKEKEFFSNRYDLFGQTIYNMMFCIDLDNIYATESEYF
ncbi:PREDICTED: uncharacterized protein LOC108772577 [Cyphomyrmex costatus]|uniref:uncharacterized protein LOC108772577 n=1 Tax=Cyphomyrmex costatus TaxID=456900 RepID=UPI0008523491|nr:PREDICTED: uncharacterized protein LOC108772577 [Cyphomyrmex costatus]